jgi:hypothetical protein
MTLNPPLAGVEYGSLDACPAPIAVDPDRVAESSRSSVLGRRLGEKRRRCVMVRIAVRCAEPQKRSLTFNLKSDKGRCLPAACRGSDVLRNLPSGGRWNASPDNSALTELNPALPIALSAGLAGPTTSLGTT